MIQTFRCCGILLQAKGEIERFADLMTSARVLSVAISRIASFPGVKCRRLARRFDAKQNKRSPRLIWTLFCAPSWINHHREVIELREVIKNPDAAT
jgi:hypothetical protein